MVMEMHVTYLVVSGGDRNMNFLQTRNINIYASLLTGMGFPVVKVCMLAYSNYGVAENFKNIICQWAIMCMCVCQMSVGGLILSYVHFIYHDHIHLLTVMKYCWNAVPGAIGYHHHRAEGRGPWKMTWDTACWQEGFTVIRCVAC